LRLWQALAAKNEPQFLIFCRKSLTTCTIASQVRIAHHLAASLRLAPDSQPVRAIAYWSFVIIEAEPFAIFGVESMIFDNFRCVRFV